MILGEHWYYWRHQRLPPQSLAAYGLQRVGQTGRADDFQLADIFTLRNVGVRHDGAGEAVLGGFGETFLAAGHRADFAGQADFAEHDQALAERAVDEARQRRQHDGQISGGFAHAHAADDVDEHVLIAQRDAAVAVQHGQQHGHADAVRAQCDAARIVQLRDVDQRLHLDQQRAAALARHHDNTAGHGLLMARQKDGGRVGDLLQAAVGHGEHTQFVDGAEAILDGADDAVAAGGLGFEIEHGVDHVLEHARPGDDALLGDVADQNQRRAGGLGVTHQHGGGLAQL